MAFASRSKAAGSMYNSRNRSESASLKGARFFDKGRSPRKAWGNESRKGIQKRFPKKEKVVGRLKVRVRGLSRSAAHKRIFILGSSRSLATNRGAGFKRSHSRFPDFLLKLSWPRKTKMNKNVSKTTTMLFYCVSSFEIKPFPTSDLSRESWFHLNGRLLSRQRIHEIMNGMRITWLLSRLLNSMEPYGVRRVWRINRARGNFSWFSWFSSRTAIMGD